MLKLSMTENKLNILHYNIQPFQLVAFNCNNSEFFVTKRCRSISNITVNTTHQNFDL